MLKELNNIINIHINIERIVFVYFFVLNLLFQLQYFSLICYNLGNSNTLSIYFKRTDLERCEDIFKIQNFPKKVDRGSGNILL